MSHRLSQNARHTNDLLEELERDKELEVLRDYLTRFNLFPRTRDPAAAPIRFEELKELVKHWKLHRQRNFWKTHTTKEDLVRTLYRHINAKIIPQENRDDGASTGAGGGVSPTITTNPSLVSSNAGVGPLAPPRKTSIQGSMTDSPRSRSILAGARLSQTVSKGPKREHIFDTYSGDLFSQRGDYEDGMIYLSRFRKPGVIDQARSKESDFEPNQEHSEEINEDVHEKLQETLDSGSVLTREVRLKQECAYSLYHFTTDAGNERRMVSEGSMLALSHLSVFDDIEVKRFCAAAILNLTCENSLCARMIEEGVLLALLELAKAQHEEVRRNTSMALCRFSYERQGQVRLVQEGCVSAIISMLNSPDSDTKEACVKALINIASHSGASVSESVVQTILKVSGKKELSNISFSAEAICNLSLLSGPRSKVVEDGILDNICELSQSVMDADVKSNLATALCNFSGVTSNLEYLSQVRVLECIEDLLKFENELVREMCSFAIANISSHAASLRNLVVSDAVVQLIDMGHKANQVIQENTALSLSNMSATVDSRPLLSRFGVVSLLLHFLEEASPLAKQHSIVALCSLMVNPSTCSELMQSNVPGVLARLSSSPQDKVRELCANALFNLSCDKSLHTFLLKDDVIKSIVRLCKRHIVTKDGNLEVEEELSPPISVNDKVPVVFHRAQEFAIGCLYNLSFFEESRKILLRVEAIKTLFGIFQRTIKNDELVRQCACIVANLTFDIESRARIVDDGCVRLIRKLMNTTGRDALLCCSTACCNLVPEGLEKTPILSMLIDLSSSPHTNITLNCAIAFSKLASTASFRPMLTKCPELYPALTLMMRCGIEDIQIYSAVALCNLAIERPQRSRHVWKEGTVPDFIVNSLLRINSESTKEICARALFNLLTHDEHRMAHIKDGVLYALVKLARLESVEIRSLCVAALYNLSCDQAMIDILMEINVAQVITKMCEIEFSNQEIHRRLAACLNNIAIKSGTEVKLVEGGALLAILVLSEHNDPPTMRHCSSILCSLSSQRVNCEAIAANNLIEVLNKVIASDDTQQNVFGLNALCNVSCLPMLHDRIEESGIIPQVLRLFSVSDEDEVSLACAKVLYNFTYHAKFRKVLLQKDIVNVFLVLSSRSPISSAVVSVSVQVISILCEDPEDWADLIYFGTVRVLGLMAPHCDDGEALIHCVYSLSQLARVDKLGLAVLSNGAMDVIAATLSQDNVRFRHLSALTWMELTDRCSAILRTLSTNVECVQLLTEDSRLMSFLLTISATGTKESKINCILALYNISASKSRSLDLLVQGGVIKLLIRLADVGGADLAPLCAISIAHIKHILKERDRLIGPDGVEIKDEMEDGMVTALMSMIDLDPPSIVKFDRMAMTLPNSSPPRRPTEWAFLPGSTTLRLTSQLPISWVFQDSPIDDARFVPPEPRSFLALLNVVIPSSGVAVQDKLYGAFQVMRVRHEKFRIKRVDPRFYRAVSTTSGTPSPTIAGAVAAAHDESAERHGVVQIERAETAVSDASSDHGGDETRSPSPTKKKSSTATKGATGIGRTASNRALNDPGLFRRGSKSSYKGSKPLLIHDPKMTKRDSQRKPTFTAASSSSSMDGDRGVILPRL